MALGPYGQTTTEGAVTTLVSTVVTDGTYTLREPAAAHARRRKRCVGRAAPILPLENWRGFFSIFGGKPKKKEKKGRHVDTRVYASKKKGRS